MKLGTFYEQILLAKENNETESIESLMDKYSTWGLEYVDIELANMEKYKDPKEFSKMLGAHGLDVGSAYYSFIFECHTSSEVKALNEGIKRCLDYVNNVNCPILMPVPVVIENHKDEAVRNECRKLVTEYLDQTAELAEKYGVVTVVENFSDTRCPFSKIEDIEYILSHAPNVKYVLDTGNFWFGNTDVLVAAKQFIDKTVHVHLKDIIPKENGFLNICKKNCDSGSIGSGIIPLEEIFEILKGANYQNGLSIEINDWKSLVQKTYESINYVKSKW